MSSYAVDSKERTLLIQNERRKLDPESWQADRDAKEIDPDHRPGSILFTSQKPIWLFAMDPKARQKIFVQFPYYAAIRIVEGTHRRATNQEIEAHRQEQEDLRTATKAKQDAEAVPGVAGLTNALAEALRQGRNDAPPANKKGN